MVVAGAREQQPVWSSRYEPLSWPPGNHVERFERSGNVSSREAVVAVLPLFEDCDEPLGRKTVEMRAGCRWTYIRDYRQLCAGARMTIDQRMEHAHPRRLTHGGRNPRNNHVRIVNIHISRNSHHLMIN